MLKADFEAALPSLLPGLRSLARRMMGDRDDAEDVVQDALVRASSSLAHFREDASLKTWLFSITTRVAIDHLRGAKRWRTQVLIDACDERGARSVAAKYGDPAVSFDVEQHISFCFTCVGRSLEPLAHAALVLKEMFQLSLEEGAAALGVTEPVFRHALAQARTAMTQEFEGLCALVNKEGPCYQCKALRELAPPAQQGRPLPPEPLSFEDRLAHARRASAEGRLSDYFFSETKRLQG